MVSRFEAERTHLGCRSTPIPLDTVARRIASLRRCPFSTMLGPPQFRQDEGERCNMRRRNWLYGPYVLGELISVGRSAGENIRVYSLVRVI